METARMIIIKLLLALILALGCAAAAQAENVEFWIGDSSGNPITEVSAAPNEQFTLSVWTTGDFDTAGTELLFGYDRCTAKGISASKMDNKIGFISAAYGSAANTFTTRLANNWYGGDYATLPGEVRPGGFDVQMLYTRPDTQSSGVGPFATAKVFDITLKNIGLASGEYYIGLWNARPAATSGCAFSSRADTINRYQDLDAGDAYNPLYGPGTGYAVKVVVPLPGSISGDVTLGDFTGDLSLAPVRIKLLQNDSVVRTEVVYLGAGGSYTIADVHRGTYDAMFEAYGWLNKKITGVTVNSQATTTLNVDLVNGDVNTDNAVNSDDLGPVLGNLDAKGDQ